MKKLIALYFIIAIYSGPVWAARIINTATVDGSTTTSVTAGDTITVSLSVTTTGGGGNNDWESTGWRIGTSSGPLTCINHFDHVFSGTFSESFTITAPLVDGNYNLYLVAYNNDSCSSGASSQFVLTNAVVVGSGGGPGACSAFAGSASLNEFFKDNTTQSNDPDDFVEIRILDGNLTYADFASWTLQVCERDDTGNNNDSDGCSAVIPLSAFTDVTPPWLVLKDGSIGLYINFSTGFDAILRDASGAVIDYLSLGGYNTLEDPLCPASSLPYDTDIGFPGASVKFISRVPDGIGDWDGPTSGSEPPTEGNSNEGQPTPLNEYRMDEISWSGTTGEVVDAQGALNATAMNGANTDQADPAVPGSPGTCGYGTFDGVNDYIDLSGMPNLSGSFTISAWIYADNTGNDQRIFADDENDNNGFAFSLGDAGNGRLRLFSRSVNPVSVDTQNAVISAGQWYHVAAVHDATARTRRIFVNGVAQTLTGGSSTPTYSGTWGVDNGVASIGGETNNAGGEAVPNWRFDGRIDEVRIYDSALSTSQINVIMTETRPCSVSVVDHFVIDVGAGSASVCSPFNFSITAEDSSNNPVTDYTGTVDITTSTSHGNFSTVTATNTVLPNPDNDDNGAASYSFDVLDAGTISMALSNVHAETLTITVSDSSIPVTSTSANVSFSENAFVITDTDALVAGDNVPVAGRDHAYQVQMVRRDSVTGICAVATEYTGNKPLKMWRTQDAADPSSVDPLLAGNNLPAAEPALANGNLTFSNGVADVLLSTSDIGRYTIELMDISRSFADVDIGGTSLEQIIRPFGIGIDFSSLRDGDFADGAMDGSAGDISYADGIGGSVFTQAGADFSITVSAVLWSPVDSDGDGLPDDDNNYDGVPDAGAYLGNNIPAPSFGGEGETVTLAASVFEPVGASLGALSVDGVAGGLFNNFSNGVQTANMTYGNVGIIDLSASLTDADYFGSGVNINGLAPRVGRFNPHHYTVMSSTVISACTALLPFTYARQPFTTNITLEAQNLQNQRTDGFRGSYATLDVTTELLFQNSATASAYDQQAFTINEGFSAGIIGSSQFDVDLRWDMPLQAATISQVNLTASTDEVVLIAGSPVNLGQTEMRFGRLNIDNVYGSELVSLNMPLQAQYYDGSNFIVNPDDGCTALTASELVLSNNVEAAQTDGDIQIQPGIVSVATIANSPLLLGDAGLSFCPPGNPACTPASGNAGYIDVGVDLSTLPHLQFDWNGDGNYDDDPFGRVTFGIYEGNSRQIYYRQIYR